MSDETTAHARLMAYRDTGTDPEARDVDALIEDATAEHDAVLKRLATAERERDEAHKLLATAAREINCAGPVHHRIQVLKREHQEHVEQARAEARRQALQDVRGWIDIDTATIQGVRQLVARIDAELEKTPSPPQPETREEATDGTHMP